MTTPAETGIRQAKVDAALEDAHAEARGQLARIGELLHDQPAPGCDYTNWGHVGDIRRINEGLTELAAILEGTNK